MDIDHQRDFLLVRGNRDLRRVDAEIQITTLQVIRAQCLQVSIQLATRVAIGFGVPAQPAARILVKLFFQCGFTECLVTNDSNVIDFGGFTFCHGERQVHTIALNRGDGCHHFRAVQAAIDVLALEFLLCTICKCLVKGAAFSQAHIAHRFLQRFLVKFFGAYKLDTGNRGALFHHHDQHIAIGLQAHILEQAQGKQGANCCCAFVIVVVITDTQRDGREDRPGLHTLQPFDTNVLNLERLQCPSCLGCTEQGCNGSSRANAKSIFCEFHL